MALYLIGRNRKRIQGSRIRFVLGCVIPRAGAVARSRNLGQALIGSPVKGPTLNVSLIAYRMVQYYMAIVDTSHVCRRKKHAVPFII